MLIQFKISPFLRYNNPEIVYEYIVYEVFCRVLEKKKKFTMYTTLIEYSKSLLFCIL